MTIQAAVDASVAGDEVVVTNGVYGTSGRVVYGTMTNRVAVYKPIAVRSVNGAQFTFIQGYQVPNTTNGDGAVRCVYLTNGASLSGFTLTNGATRASGDWFQEQSGGGVWCESTNAMISNCVVVGNAAAQAGGGIFCASTNSLVFDCILAGNTAEGGGGADGGTLANSFLTHNTALNGGGARGSILNNCTVTANAGPVGGGSGIFSCVANNSIIYYNTGGDWEYSSTLNYCCTFFTPTNNATNIGADPQLADQFHLSTASPCRGRGSGDYASGFDIDGEAWLNPPSIGCDEYISGSITGLLSVTGIQVDYTAFQPGFTVNFTGVIAGHASVSYWDFGDGTVVSNLLSLSHAWAKVGDYPVALHAYNETYPGGVSTNIIVHVVAQPVTDFQAWLAYYGLPTDGSADYVDTDGDGMNNWQEWVCGTDPTNRLSVLRMLPPTVTSSNVIVSWQSVATVSYFLERSTNLESSPVFSVVATNVPGQSGTNFPGQGGVTSFADTNAPGGAQLFYRVGVRR